MQLLNFKRRSPSVSVTVSARSWIELSDCAKRLILGRLVVNYGGEEANHGEASNKTWIRLDCE